MKYLCVFEIEQGTGTDAIYEAVGVAMGHIEAISTDSRGTTIKIILDEDRVQPFRQFISKRAVLSDSIKMSGPTPIYSWMPGTNSVSIYPNPNPHFTVVFSESLSAEQVKGTLEALAEYFRACGGAGFGFDFEFEYSADGALAHA